jgi:hypothetical protein
MNLTTETTQAIINKIIEGIDTDPEQLFMYEVKQDQLNIFADGKIKYDSDDNTIIIDVESIECFTEDEEELDVQNELSSMMYIEDQVKEHFESVSSLAERAHDAAAFKLDMKRGK